MKSDSGKGKGLAAYCARVQRLPVREAVSYRGLFTAGWFGVREKHCSWPEIYDRLRASEQAELESTTTTVGSPLPATLCINIFS